MSQDPILTHKRLDEIWASTSVPALRIKGSKYIILSDLHLGDGGRADDFWPNRHVLRAALEYYGDLNYRLLLLGDIEELWQFALPEIKTRYGKTIYQAIRDFGDSRINRIFGNHDGDWNIEPDPAKNIAFSPVQATEAVKLLDEKGVPRILLVHGHQGDMLCDKNSWSSRIAVRLFRLVEPVAELLGIVHAPKMRHQTVNYYERVMYSWAKKVRAILICGHSHNAIFASRSFADRLREQISTLEREIRSNPSNKELIYSHLGQVAAIKKKIGREKKHKRDILAADDPSRLLPCYFNTGCGTYDDGITGIEISNGEIRLAKWHRTPSGPRYEIYQKGNLGAFIDQAARGTNGTRLGSRPHRLPRRTFGRGKSRNSPSP